MAIKSLKTGLTTRSAMAGNSIIMPGSFESIATVSVGAGGASTITFSSIPSTYTHLQIRFSARNNTNTQNIMMYANGDTTGTNYRTHYLNGDGSTASASQYQLSSAYFSLGDATATASNFAAGIVDILDYANTNKYKVSRILNGRDTNGAGNIYFMSSLWLNTAAITSLTIFFSTYNIAQYSTFALYGVN